MLSPALPFVLMLLFFLVLFSILITSLGEERYSGDISKGASPDGEGKVDDRKKSDKFGIVEIKCPFEKKMIFHQMLLAMQTSGPCLLLSDSRTNDY